MKLVFHPHLQIFVHLLKKYVDVLGQIKRQKEYCLPACTNHDALTANHLKTSLSNQNNSPRLSDGLKEKKEEEDKITKKINQTSTFLTYIC